MSLPPSLSKYRSIYSPARSIVEQEGEIFVQEGVISIPHDLISIQARVGVWVSSVNVAEGTAEGRPEIILELKGDYTISERVPLETAMDKLEATETLDIASLVKPANNAQGSSSLEATLFRVNGVNLKDIDKIETFDAMRRYLLQQGMTDEDLKTNYSPLALELKALRGKNENARNKISAFFSTIKSGIVPNKPLLGLQRGRDFTYGIPIPELVSFVFGDCKKKYWKEAPLRKVDAFDMYVKIAPGVQGPLFREMLLVTRELRYPICNPLYGLPRNVSDRRKFDSPFRMVTTSKQFTLGDTDYNMDRVDLAQQPSFDSNQKGEIVALALIKRAPHTVYRV